MTTNFDNRFLEAAPDVPVADAAPKLPLPKRHSGSSLVHPHGRIVEDDDGSNLVLTAADLGRAYLTERWTARFVSELFREFTVVVVDYGVADPMMEYLVDALAAERDKGARITKQEVPVRRPPTPRHPRQCSDPAVLTRAVPK